MNTSNETVFISKFPIYSLAYHEKSSSLILGGGGGPSRSGIPNGLLVLKIVSTNKSKSKFSFEEAGELRTGDEAVMSLSLYDDKTDCLIVAGVNDRCWLLEFDQQKSNSPDSRVSSIVKALNNGQSPIVTGKNSSSLNLLRTIQSDSSPSDDGYLRVTRFTASGRSFLAAGSDGSVREWAVPEMRLLSKIETDGETLDADGREELTAIVTSSGQIKLEIPKKDSINLVPSSGFSFKLVRILKSKSKNLLYAIENFKMTAATSKSAKKYPKLLIFDLDRLHETQKSLKPIKIHSLPFPKNCTTFTIHESSDRAAFGFADGSLLVISLTNPSSVFLSKKLAHPFPVTGLAIDPEKEILMSSSADGQILINQVPSKPISGLCSFSATIFFTIFFILSLIVLLFAIFSQNFLSKLSEIDDFDSFYKLFPTEIVDL